MQDAVSEAGRKPPGRFGDVAEPRHPIRPDGGLVTIADLPAQGTKRWVIRRKAIVVAAIRGGLLTLEEARTRYALTVDELLDWQYSIDRHGFPGLRITRIQKYPRRGRPSSAGTPAG
jgi:hypothetical protein